jgi:hypothetical protein
MALDSAFGERDAFFVSPYKDYLTTLILASQICTPEPREDMNNGLISISLTSG